MSLLDLQGMELPRSDNPQQSNASMLGDLCDDLGSTLSILVC
jgi:hypothetical protein